MKCLQNEQCICLRIYVKYCVFFQLYGERVISRTQDSNHFQQGLSKKVFLLPQHAGSKGWTQRGRRHLQGNGSFTLNKHLRGLHNVFKGGFTMDIYCSRGKSSLSDKTCPICILSRTLTYDIIYPK